MAVFNSEYFAVSDTGGLLDEAAVLEAQNLESRNDYLRSLLGPSFGLSQSAPQTQAPVIVTQPVKLPASQPVIQPVIQPVTEPVRNFTPTVVTPNTLVSTATAPINTTPEQSLVRTIGNFFTPTVETNAEPVIVPQAVPAQTVPDIIDIGGVFQQNVSGGAVTPTTLFSPVTPSLNTTTKAPLAQYIKTAPEPSSPFASLPQFQTQAPIDDGGNSPGTIGEIVALFNEQQGKVPIASTSNAPIVTRGVVATNTTTDENSESRVLTIFGSGTTGGVLSPLRQAGVNAVNSTADKAGVPAWSLYLAGAIVALSLFSNRGKK